ncbi:MAG: BREX system P-loop protein BrxC [Akkermansiaceae bacterium]|nr:BREX system P-loop protein BrxC [Akkermansiaceae bacterium]
MQIRELFDSNRAIDRRIEKVITFSNDDEKLLLSEVSEYVVTDSLEHHYENLLDRLDEALHGGGGFETCAWISGFYGSGKSSFAKYLGFSLDPQRSIGGTPFRDHFANQFDKAALRQRLGTVAQRHEVTVFMLDLAAQMGAGSLTTPISTLLYNRVMAWAGYSAEMKVAEFEFLLEKDGRKEDFENRVQEIAKGKTWKELQRSTLALKGVASQLAPEFYPEYFPDSKAFNEITLESPEVERERVERMLDLVKRRTGSHKVLFLIDEVGHFLSSNKSLINNFDGLCKNIKEVGGGTAWLMATAQQTLTKDGPFFPLMARLPIPVELESSDIQEITHRRLLRKSDAGTARLEQDFAGASSKLKLSTKLEGVKAYQKEELEKTKFVQLYPFLPHHFELLMDLLAVLAHSSGGLGLRSAIKVIQDMLVEADTLVDGPLADRDVGQLATMADIFDTLSRDIEPRQRHLVETIQAVVKSYGKDEVATRAAKSVAILQQLEGFPITKKNIAALLHPAIDAQPLETEVIKQTDALIDDQSVPLGIIDGKLRFLSEKVGLIDSNRDQLQPRSNDKLAIRNKELQEIFSTKPSTSLDGARKVESGVAVSDGGRAVSLIGDNAEIQTLIDLVASADYDSTKKARIDESRLNDHSSRIFLLAELPSEVDSLVTEIYRCREICRANSNEADPDVVDYVRGQETRERELRGKLQELLRVALKKGLFIFRGKQEALADHGSETMPALKKFLGDAAKEIFDKYSQAGEEVASNIAEKLLLTNDLSQVSSKIDPLGLVKKQGSKTQVDLQHAALVSVRDYLDKHGQSDGARLLNEFYSAPFGWSKDTTRYFIAALLIGGAVKIKLGGETTTVPGETALAALKSNQALSKTTIYPNNDQVPQDQLLRAAKRLHELLAENVLPMAKQISQAVQNHFPSYQQSYAGLEAKLEMLGLPGGDRAQQLLTGLAGVLSADASDAPATLGAETSTLYDDLLWARAVTKALDQGAETTVKESLTLLNDIVALPDAGACVQLKADSEETRAKVRTIFCSGKFHEHISELNQHLQSLRTVAKQGASDFLAQEAARLDKAKDEIKQSSDWLAAPVDIRESLEKQLEDLKLDLPTDLDGARKLPARRMEVDNKLESVRVAVTEAVAEKQFEKEKSEETLQLPARLQSTADLDAALEQLEGARATLDAGTPVNLTLGS